MMATSRDPRLLPRSVQVWRTVQYDMRGDIDRHIGMPINKQYDLGLELEEWPEDYRLVDRAGGMPNLVKAITNLRIFFRRLSRMARRQAQDLLTFSIVTGVSEGSVRELLKSRRYRRLR